MIQPMAFRRKLPRNDWEGDDFPDAYKTCTATAAGRAVAWATNGRSDLDGKVYRTAAAVQPDGGQTLPEAQFAIRRVAGLELVIPAGWDWSDALGQLVAGRGLVIQGAYMAIPRPYRYQLFADFNHAMWVSHYSPTSGMRVWDPLNPDVHGFGRWVPLAAVRAFALSLSQLSVAFVPLQPL